MDEGKRDDVYVLWGVREGSFEVVGDGFQIGQLYAVVLLNELEYFPRCVVANVGLEVLFVEYEAAEAFLSEHEVLV
jgi:hypothetical protein